MISIEEDIVLVLREATFDSAGPQATGLPVMLAIGARGGWPQLAPVFQIKRSSQKYNIGKLSGEHHQGVPCSSRTAGERGVPNVASF
jgi:hypothetical protein